MLKFLFGRLTAAPSVGSALFDSLIAVARRRDWYLEGEVPDTIDGRFAVLASVAALAVNRAEQLGPAGEALSVALTERFVEVMEAEHRELGLGDPTLGKTVRSLVGSLARRVGLWRQATTEQVAWDEATRSSLYHVEPSAAALGHSGPALRNLWQALADQEVAALAEGKTE